MMVMLALATVAICTKRNPKLCRASQLFSVIPILLLRSLSKETNHVVVTAFFPLIQQQQQQQRYCNVKKPSSHTKLHIIQRPQNGQLRPATIEPRNTRSELSQWFKFSGLVAALSLAFRKAGQMDLLGLGTIPWSYVSIGYPALIITATIFYFIAFGSVSGSGRKIAESMGGIPCPPNSRIDVLLDQVYQYSNQQQYLGERPLAYVIPTMEPNAFAAGSSKESVVAVTQGLLNQLNDNQLRAVLAHEIAHLRNRDTKQSLKLAAMVAALGAARTVGSLLLRQTPRRNSGQDNDNDDKKLAAIYRGVGYVLVATGVVTVLLGSLLRLGSSRTAEFAADAFAKDIGIGKDLASALEVIHQTNLNAPPRDSAGLGLASGAFSHLYIDNPPNLESPITNMFGLLRTHPPTKDRIKRLLA